jgi:hypothetical protein
MATNDGVAEVVGKRTLDKVVDTTEQEDKKRHKIE